MRELLARRRRKRILILAKRLGVEFLILEHYSGWSVQIDGITISRSGAGKIRRRYPTLARAEIVLLDELNGISDVAFDV